MNIWDLIGVTELGLGSLAPDVLGVFKGDGVGLLFLVLSSGEENALAEHHNLCLARLLPVAYCCPHSQAC